MKLQTPSKPNGQTRNVALAALTFVTVFCVFVVSQFSVKASTMIDSSTTLSVHLGSQAQQFGDPLASRIGNSLALHKGNGIESIVNDSKNPANYKFWCTMKSNVTINLLPKLPAGATRWEEEDIFNRLPRHGKGDTSSVVVGGFYCRPRFFLLGAEKAGSTTLATVLSKAPAICNGHQLVGEKSYFKKEIHFFGEYPHNPARFIRHFPLNRCKILETPGLGRGINVANTRAGFLDASPMLHKPYAIEGMGRYYSTEQLKELYFAVSLRHPVDRDLSYYNHRVKLKRSSVFFEN